MDGFVVIVGFCVSLNFDFEHNFIIIFTSHRHSTFYSYSFNRSQISRKKKDPEEISK